MFKVLDGATAPTRATKYSAMVDLYENEVQCRYDGGKIESAERLKDNYSVSFNCMERSK